MSEEQTVELGTDQIEPAIEALGEIGNVIESVVHGDYKAIINIADDIFAMIKTDWKTFLAQVKDLNSEEMAHLKVIFKNKFDLSDDVIEGIVEEAIESLETTGHAVDSWIKFGKKVKELKEKK